MLKQESFAKVSDVKVPAMICAEQRPFLKVETAENMEDVKYQYRESTGKGTDSLRGTVMDVTRIGLNYLS